MTDEPISGTAHPIRLRVQDLVVIKTRSILVSQPDVRLLVGSATDNNHETTLVVPELGQAQVPYCRVLVDEGSQFHEHSVAWLDNVQHQSGAIVTRALSAARPTRVSVLVQGADSELIVLLGRDPLLSQLAAAVVSLLQLGPGRSLSPLDTEPGPQINLQIEDGISAIGTARITLIRQFYQVDFDWVGASSPQLKEL